MAHIAEILAAPTIQEVWRLHVARMRAFGFDRMIYGASPYVPRDTLRGEDGALVLFEHDGDYIKRFTKDSFFRHSPMARWSAANTGAMSWRWAFDRQRRGETTAEENRVLAVNAEFAITAGYSISFRPRWRHAKSAIGLCARRGLDQDAVDEIWRRDGDAILLLNEVMDQRLALLPYTPPNRRLTPRQREVLELVAEGKSARDIAAVLGISERTVEKHLRLARVALDAETTAQAVLKATLQRGLFRVPGGS